jgi:hypothetical protein
VNKRLESLIVRVPTWPEEAQDEAARALDAIERKHVRTQPLTGEEREAKLASLRETINRSIEAGGSHTDEDVAAHLERLHAQAEQEGH